MVTVAGSPAVSPFARLGQRDYRRTPDHVRFWSKVRKTRGCWLWQGGLSKYGYGKFQLTLPHDPAHLKPKQKHVAAHRYAFKLKTGRWPRGYLLHECDTPGCVRICADHVHEGGQRRNVRDGLRRGRSRRCTTPTIVRRIRRECPRGKGVVRRMREAAARYGLSPTAVCWIVYRVTWRWVK